MLHCDDDELSLIALGEPAGAEDEAHLQSCPRCQSRLDQLSAVVSSARAITEEDRPTEPPTSVWSAIEADLGLTGTVTPLRSKTRSSRLWLVASAAAVVGLVVGGVVTSAIARTPAPEAVLATANLSPIEGSGLTGTATVAESPEGPVLHVSVADLPSVTDGYYEVWMATSDTSTMVAIGTLNPGENATFVLPAGMAMDQFPVVDVSVEHFDGDPGHSAVSVVRGQLSA